MKKIILISTVFISLFYSCSKDESNSLNSKITVTINGTKKVFNAVKILRKEGDINTGIFLEVIGTIDNKQNETLSMQFEYNNRDSGVFIPSISYTFISNTNDTIRDSYYFGNVTNPQFFIGVEKALKTNNILQGTISDGKFTRITFKDCNFTIYN
jgi:hypothetical protein